MRRTKREYEDYLNSLCPDYESDEWIIGGKDRRRMYPNYGKAIRTHDPIAFEVGYREWKL